METIEKTFYRRVTLSFMLNYSVNCDGTFGRHLGESMRRLLLFNIFQPSVFQSSISIA